MPEKTLTEYLSNVRSELTRNAWHYSPDHAALVVLRNMDDLLQDFQDQKPSWNAAMEVGFNET